MVRTRQLWVCALMLCYGEYIWVFNKVVSTASSPWCIIPRIWVRHTISVRNKSHYTKRGFMFILETQI